MIFPSGLCQDETCEFIVRNVTDKSICTRFRVLAKINIDYVQKNNQSVCNNVTSCDLFCNMHVRIHSYTIHKI